MASEPSVSILLPARDAASTLEEALASLAAQTHADWECLLVDDGSRDGTRAIARAWAARDRRIRLIPFDEPRGIVASLERAAAEARAPRLARQDADDRSHPRRLERALALLEGDPSLGAVACRVRLFPEESLAGGWRAYGEWLNAALTPQEIAREIWVESPLPHPAVVLRREAFAQCGGYREVPWPEDYDLWLRMHLAGWRFAKSPETLYDWRHHARRLTCRDPRYAPAAFLACKLEHLDARLRRHPLILWGAGREGRRLARALAARGLAPRAFIDIDPRKIGGVRQGHPVFSPAALEAGGPLSRAELSGSLILVAVGSRGARAIIRSRLAALGRIETEDYLCLH